MIREYITQKLKFKKLPLPEKPKRITRKFLNERYDALKDIITGNGMRRMPTYLKDMFVFWSPGRIINMRHYQIYTEIEWWNFHLEFREGKVKTIETAYQKFKKEGY